MLKFFSRFELPSINIPTLLILTLGTPYFKGFPSAYFSTANPCLIDVAKSVSQCGSVNFYPMIIFQDKNQNRFNWFVINTIDCIAKKSY